MTDQPKFVEGMTNQALINALLSLPPAAPVIFGASESKLYQVNFDGQKVRLS